MKISRVQIKNYRNLKQVSVSLGSIATLIGENNSGKTNFLRAISLPLSPDEGVGSKRLSWYDINKEAKNQYYEYLNDNKEQIIKGDIEFDEFCQQFQQ